jgi:O-antigen ligase
MFTTRAQQLGWYLWLLLVVLSPASAKVAGAAWIIAIVWGFWLAHAQAKLPADTLGAQALYRATDFILWFFVLAFVLRTIGQAYWWDNWQYRHFDARMLFTAIAMHIVVRRITFTTKRRNELVLALALASITALYVVFEYIRINTSPTTIIPWAYGMVLFSIVLASVRLIHESTQTKATTAIHWLSSAAAALFLIAVFLSGVRGAYFAALWVACIVIFSLKHTLSLRLFKNKYLWMSSIVVALGLGILIKSVPQVYEIPQARIAIAIAEIKGFQDDKRDSSVGIRLHFVEKGIEAYLQKPWLGYGIEQRTELVNQWAVDVDPLFTDMTHTHNEYLNAILDYGVLGGAALLSYLLGLMLAVFTLWRVNVPLTVTLASFCFATFSTFLTNANTLHNYTSVTLGLALLYSVFFFARSTPSCASASHR